MGRGFFTISPGVVKGRGFAGDQLFGQHSGKCYKHVSDTVVLGEDGCFIEKRPAKAVVGFGQLDPYTFELAGDGHDRMPGFVDSRLISFGLEHVWNLRFGELTVRLATGLRRTPIHATDV